MKNLKNLNGAKVLSKNEQKSINGGMCNNPTGCANNPCGRCSSGMTFDTDSCMCILDGFTF